TDARHPTAYARLCDAPLFDELRPVGRLDLDTTGLLIWTTSGAWLQRLTHPKRKLPRSYHAALARPFGDPRTGLALKDGHQPHIVELKAIREPQAHPSLLRSPDAACFATITIVGGAYHEVRRIFAALGSHVVALSRVGYGRLTLPSDLPAGAWRPL